MKNKGFTLIELIVAMAVGSIVLLMVSIMLVRGTNIFRSENDEVNMRNDYQIVRNQLDQAIMEATAISVEKRVVSGKVKEIIIYTGQIDPETRALVDNKTTERVITYNVDDRSIYISGSYEHYKAEGNCICNMVENFDIELDKSSEKKDKDGKAYYPNPIRINITLALKQKKSVINSSFSINLRNRLKDDYIVYITSGAGQKLSSVTGSNKTVYDVK